MRHHRPTVVVPCAGRGTRLGLPFGKELLPIGGGRVVLDALFDLLDGEPVRVVLVVSADRQATIGHVHDRYPHVPAAAVRQPATDPGLAGAVRAALPWCTPRTVVLLPDQVLRHPPDGSLVSRTVALLDRHPACLLAAAETDPHRIGVDGALRVSWPADGPARVTALADKPGPAAAGRFNAVWFGFGFRHTAAETVLAHLDLAAAGTLNEATFAAGPLANAPVLDVPPFVDLGTWPAVHAYWRTAGAACG